MKKVAIPSSTEAYFEIIIMERQQLFLTLSQQRKIQN